MPFDGVGLTQLASDLIAARQVLLDEGWHPGCGQQSGPHCALTAGRKMLGWNFRDDPPRLDRTKAVSRALQAALGKRNGVDVAYWNDQQRSIEPVLALFDRAIAAAL